jgi:two-component system alkaline phosphatase synthesis response regulator PhoP
LAKILIADDELSVRELLRFALERDGHQIIESATGLSTLDALKKNKPIDLLVLDVMLPGMDGYALQMEIAQDPDLSRIPVIVLTAVRPLRNMFEKFGQVKSFIMKPFDPVELAQNVKALLAAPKH